MRSTFSQTRSQWSVCGKFIRVRRRLRAGQSFPDPGKGRVADPPGTTGSGARQLSGNIYNGARMALTPGTKLGPYEIQSPLGAGGMGEVHRARDTRLSRDVAIKVLPDAFARDADRLQRFEHEARVNAGPGLRWADPTPALLLLPLIANEGGRGNERQDVLRFAWMNLNVGN